MWLVYAGMVLIALKLLDVGLTIEFLKPLSTLSWWWIAAVFLVAFIYFEFIEPLLGLDKRKLVKNNELEAERLSRVRKSLGIQRPISKRK